jgi:5-methylcytosine-specific restriction endonuclease McrA
MQFFSYTLFLFYIMSQKFTKEKRKSVLDKYGGKCAYCGVNVSYSTMQIDHIKPVYRSSTNKELSVYGITKGTNDINNLNPSCKSCNASKSTFTVNKWREELALKTMRLRRDNSTFRILERFKLIKATSKDIVFHFERGGQDNG